MRIIAESSCRSYWCCPIPVLETLPLGNDGGCAVLGTARRILENIETDLEEEQTERSLHTTEAVDQDIARYASERRQALESELARLAEEARSGTPGLN